MRYLHPSHPRSQTHSQFRQPTSLPLLAIPLPLITLITILTTLTTLTPFTLAQTTECHLSAFRCENGIGIGSDVTMTICGTLGGETCMCAHAKKSFCQFERGEADVFYRFAHECGAMGGRVAASCLI